MKKIIFTVTNDLSYDQRMDRICSSLSQAGYKCELVGRTRPNSLPLETKYFQQKRLKCWFDKGFAFYAEYNIRLFFYLLAQKTGAICSIDLDTVLPGYFASKLKNRPHIFDGHEYFSEMEEVVSRPLVYFVWKRIERFSMPKVKFGYTIGENYARIFKSEYDRKLEVIRNLPVRIESPATQQFDFTIIYQGAINIGRGLEEMIEAMVELKDKKLVIIGDGTELNSLKQLAKKFSVIDRVEFKGALLPKNLKTETGKHWLGLTLFSHVGEHHQLSLANRFFDYAQSHVPQIAMNYPEYAQLNNEFNFAYLLDELTPKTLVQLIHSISADKVLYELKKNNCVNAAKALCWENESKKLVEFYNRIL